MLVIIDGGSTKADWKIESTDEKPAIIITAQGFNPNYDPSEIILEKVQKVAIDNFRDVKPTEVYYYGAGCWDAKRKSIVAKVFMEVFPNSKIAVNHDLLAAARATCGDAPGIACILGTGSNSVLYDGVNEIDNVTNLGFILGDEGSGAVIGKEIVKSYFYREMPVELQSIIEKECPNGKTDILNKVYAGGVPAAYLASFTKLYADNKSHPFIWNLVKMCFKDFFERHIVKYENYQNLSIHFVGSIAYHYQEILIELMNDLGLAIGKILPRPIDALYQYHKVNPNLQD